MKESPFNGIYLQPRHRGKWVAWSIYGKEVLGFSANLSKLFKRMRNYDPESIVYLMG